MKNKKLLYILFPLVILIWGAIFYKIFYYESPGEEWKEEAVSPLKNIVTLSVPDTFNIIADYRDPFLGTIVHMEKAPDRPMQPKVVQPPKIKVAVIWPNIVYGGMIKNQQSSQELALVKINGKENIIKAGDKVGDIELIKIYKDSIEVRMGKAVKVVRK